MNGDACEAFVRAHTRPAPAPLRPDIELHLADALVPLWQATEAATGRHNPPPPFWAFAWAGGAAVAAWLADHPREVEGARVLDFASGSGLVAIAAAKAGAAAVTAADIDPLALAAIRLNAARNQVEVRALGDNLVGAPVATDMILIGDAFYTRDLAAMLLPWLLETARRGSRILVGDPDRAWLPRERFTRLATYEATTSLEIEDSTRKTAHVWQLNV